MNQNLWGPAYWFTFHTITFQYPFHPTEEQKNSYKLFFEQLQYLLPCKYCREHFKLNWKEVPIQLENRRALVLWLIKFHNQVNIITGKPIMTEDQVLYWYEKYFGHKIILDDQQLKEEKKEEKEYSNVDNIIPISPFPISPFPIFGNQVGKNDQQFWLLLSFLIIIFILLCYFYNKK